VGRNRSAHTTGVAGDLWLSRQKEEFLGGGEIRLLREIDANGSITRAARVAGISYKTAWDTVNRINNLADRPLVERLAGGKGGGGTRLTPAGRSLMEQYAILEEEHGRFLNNLSQRLVNGDGLYTLLRRISMKVSARNTFSGTVTAITSGVVNAEVTLTLKGGLPLTATITNGAVENLGLKAGIEAYAIIKASSVIIGTDLHDARVSARNIFCGTIVRIIEGPVNTEVDIEIGGDTTVSAVITHDSATRLGLQEGGHACAMFKASSVIIGVD
jgi:molybdate transport system regulatory protein